MAEHQVVTCLRCCKPTHRHPCKYKNCLWTICKDCDLIYGNGRSMRNVSKETK